MSRKSFISAREKNYFEGMLQVLENVKPKDKPAVLKKSLKEVDRAKFLRFAHEAGMLPSTGVSDPAEVGLPMSKQELFSGEAA